MNATGDLFDIGKVCADDNAEFARLRREQAQQRRDEAIQRVVEHADRVRAEWSDQAFRLLRVYATTRDSLTAEEVREWSESVGLDRPPDNRAWGGVIRRARFAGLLGKGEYEEAKDPRVHCRPIMRWRSLIAK